MSFSWTSSSTGAVSIASRSPNEVSPSSPTGLSSDHRAVGLADLDHVGQRQVRRVGDLLVGRLVTELGRQLALDPAHLARPLRHVDGQADRAAGVLQAALDRLADPQRRVGREAEALAPVELLDGADQPEHPLLDQVAEREALALVAARVGHHQAQVGVDHAVLGDEVALLDALRQLDLLGGREQLEAARLAQEELERVEGRVDVSLVLLLGVLGARGVSMKVVDMCLLRLSRSRRKPTPKSEL